VAQLSKAKLQRLTFEHDQLQEALNWLLMADQKVYYTASDIMKQLVGAEVVSEAFFNQKIINMREQKVPNKKAFIKIEKALNLEITKRLKVLVNGTIKD
jgi:hypothetical protein